MKNIWTELNNNVSKHMEKVIHCYSLKCVKIGELNSALVGKGFAIIISIDRFYVTISYLTKCDNQYVLFQCNNYLREKFDSKDRAGLIDNDDIKNDIINELVIISNGLMDKWKDLLNGDKTWIDDYKKSRWYSEKKVNEKENKIFYKLLN